MIEEIVCLAECSIRLLEKNVYSTVGVSINVYTILSVDDVIQIFYILAGFLSSVSINSSETAVEALQYNCGIVCSSL